MSVSDGGEIFGKKKNENDAAEKHSFSDELPEMNAYDVFDPADSEEEDDNFDQFPERPYLKENTGELLLTMISFI